MKTKTNKIFLIVCAALTAALLLSVIGLIAARSDVKELEADVLALTEENQQLKMLNQALQTQMGILEDSETFCELSVTDWSASGDTLNVSAHAYASLPIGAQVNARLELWHGPKVVGSEPVTLTAGIVGSYDADVTAAFKIPALQEDEELQLWLVIDSDSFNTISFCGASWYEEGGQLMVVAG